MFDAFSKEFSPDPGRYARLGSAGSALNIAGLRTFFDLFGGTSFNGGVYRAVHPADLDEWNARIVHAFPQFEGRITSFGYDWLGRVFALDIQRMEDGQPGVVMFEPGTGEALEIPANLGSFHDSELIEYGEPALAISFYNNWLASGGSAPGYKGCIGYKKPLFLGGQDEVSNLEDSDLDVYWHLMGQLILKARGLPEGTPIRVDISDI